MDTINLFIVDFFYIVVLTFMQFLEKINDIDQKFLLWLHFAFSISRLHAYMYPC